MRSSERIQRDEGGFTLPELLVAMGMMMVVMLAGLGLFQVAQRTQPQISSDNAKIQAAQVGVERLTRELRQTRSVISFSTTSLTVETYLSRATCTGGALGTARLCRVTYSCAGGSCTRTPAELPANGGAVGTASTFSTDLVSNAIFSYLPAGVTQASNVTSINLALSFRSEDGSSEDAITLSDGVSLRNVAGAVG